MKIGIIGSGAMGRYFAAQFVKLGHAVSIANSRGPASLQQFASEIVCGSSSSWAFLLSRYSTPLLRKAFQPWAGPKGIRTGLP